MAKQAQIDIDNFGTHVVADLAARGEAPVGAAPSTDAVAAAARDGLAGVSAPQA
jgi:hypothetical protein